MKKLNFLVIALFLGITFQMNAQTAEEVVASYFENTGGVDNWKKLTGVKMYAEVNQGMIIPIEITQLKGGKQMTVINFQGKEIKQGVFDGETLWSHNFMTQKAEKSDKENTDNAKLAINDFPDPFLNYKTSGYTVELMGSETIDGADTFKIKLVKKPLTVDGKLEDNITFYYFDKENFVPIAVHNEIKSGPMKGQMSEIKMSDYQEIEGLFFPFSMSQGLKGQAGQAISIKKIELNPKVDEKAFLFPEETPATPSGN
ncbi:outer membrane lipoprotein-sorting protein [Lutibacter sp.]|uniref:outer membrane lipoprotein-sorting protein n=1 Tax=Lutibacter sp. TaxID=1925666 RepID=UPI00273439A2|nr:outer membrane lipoprotein-sorting protein [Lutibacter sp.]MDP3313376.1 outer membrane lipoprotein-sorting protein [Lutibacter sp.]